MGVGKAHHDHTTCSRVAVIRSCTVSSDIPAAMSWQRAGRSKVGLEERALIPSCPGFLDKLPSRFACQSGVWTATVGDSDVTSFNAHEEITSME